MFKTDETTTIKDIIALVVMCVFIPGALVGSCSSLVWVRDGARFSCTDETHTLTEPNGCGSERTIAAECRHSRHRSEIKDGVLLCKCR